MRVLASLSLGLLVLVALETGAAADPVVLGGPGPHLPPWSGEDVGACRTLDALPAAGLGTDGTLETADESPLTPAHALDSPSWQVLLGTPRLTFAARVPQAPLEGDPRADVAVPEPSSVALLGLGLGIVAISRRRRRRA